MNNDSIPGSVVAGDVLDLRHPLLARPTRALCLKVYAVTGVRLVLCTLADHCVHAFTAGDLTDLGAAFHHHLPEFETYPWANLAQVWSHGEIGVFNGMYPEPDDANA